MKPTRSQRLVEWLRRDWRELVLSVLVAIVIFFTVRGNISHAVSYTVEVDVEREPGMAIMSVRPASVRVTFRGALSDLRTLDVRSLRAVVRPPRGAASAGSERVRLHGRNIHGRGSARAVDIQPSEVLLSFDHQGEREFSVAPPPTEGQPLRGQASVAYTPHTVRVRGARLQLDQLHAKGVTLQTEPIDLEGRAQSFVRSVRVLPPAEAWMPEVDPAAVTATVTIVTEREIREFAEVPVRVAPPPGFAGSLSPSPAHVTLRLGGRPEVLRGLAAGDLHVFADVPTSDAVTGAVPVRVALPPGSLVDSVVAEPEAVRLRLEPADVVNPRE